MFGRKWIDLWARATHRGFQFVKHPDGRHACVEIWLDDKTGFSQALPWRAIRVPEWRDNVAKALCVVRRDANAARQSRRVA